MTRQGYAEICQRNTKYFGAATLTEWNVARLCSNRYTFVLVIMDTDNPEEMIDSFEYSIEDLLFYSTIPPFKINFNIPFRKPDSPHPTFKSSSRSVHAVGDSEHMFNRLNALITYYTNELGGKLVVPDNLKDIKDETF